MDFARQQYERIRKQLEGLTASQRMLTAMLLVVMGVTLVYWVRYAGKPEMEVLLDQPMSATDLTRIRLKLDGMGVAYQVTGDRLLVATEQRMAALRALTYDQALPANSTAGWDAIVKQMNWFNSEAQNQRWWLQAKQDKLVEVIRGWPGVTGASVIIDATERRSFTNPVGKSATVNIQTAEGRQGLKKLALSAADMVAGSESGLDRTRVRVVINGASFPVRAESGEDQGFAADDLMEARQQEESYYSEKIRNQLRWIQPEVIATVAVDINSKSTQEEATIYDPKGTAKVETKSRSKTNEDKTETAQSGEPGVGANTQGALADAGAAGPKQSRNENEDETDFQSGLSSTRRATREQPGRATVLSAVVRVPQSYFVHTYKERNGGQSAKDPDDATLAPYLERELAKIRAEVKGCVAVADEKSVVVETYYDAGPVEAGSPVVAPTMGVAGVVGGHGKEVALGALAVISLFMMMMMVRKGSPAPVAVVAAAEPEGPLPELAAGEEIVGEAGDGETVLGGMELDEDAAKAQQMLGQVSDLVKDNPDAAATLIKRWLNK